MSLISVCSFSLIVSTSARRCNAEWAQGFPRVLTLAGAAVPPASQFQKTESWPGSQPSLQQAKPIHGQRPSVQRTAALAPPPPTVTQQRAQTYYCSTFLVTRRLQFSASLESAPVH